ncbi:MAG: hypothetical protein SF052_23705 [Bacteroidia bacterium]|nr:hypothetical protein [Bacteroidia bacterium]
MVFIFFACQRGDSPYQPPTSPSALQAAFSARLLQGDSIPISKEALLEVLPTQTHEYTAHSTSGSSFLTRRFASAQKLYKHPDGGFMKITLADYAADSAAYLFIFRRYLQQHDSLSPPPSGLPKDVFLWSSTDTLLQTRRFEAGIRNRYHISCTGSVPEAKDFFRKIVNEIDRKLPD